MGATVRPARQSPPVPDGEPRGLGPAKFKAAYASLPTTTTTFTYGAAIWEVLVKAHGSTKATAITMGNRDRSLLRREVLNGSLTLAQLLQADDKALAAFGEFLIDNFGDSKKSKGQIARERLPELLAAFMDLVSEAEKEQR